MTVGERELRNGFDKLALPYRWMEYLSFGPLLWRTRVALLPNTLDARNALVLGDGDGRFTAALLRANRKVQVHSVDASGAMLALLQRRVAEQGDADRVQLSHTDATGSLPRGCFDLVCTHFFLDCLSDEQCVALTHAVADRMAPSAYWILSEFAIPPGRLRGPARLLIRLLYGAFGILTGLRVRHLPEYAAALRSAGLQRASVQSRLGGILRSEMWVLLPPG